METGHSGKAGLPTSSITGKRHKDAEDTRAEGSSLHPTGQGELMEVLVSLNLELGQARVEGVVVAALGQAAFGKLVSRSLRHGQCTGPEQAERPGQAGGPQNQPMWVVKLSQSTLSRSHGEDPA